MEVKVLKVEDAENCRKKLELEIPNDEVSKKVEELFTELQKSALIPGFRAGHAPRKVIETRYAKKVRSQAIEDLLPTAYEQVVKEQKFEVLGSPMVTEIKADPEQPVLFKVEFEVRPNVTLGNYLEIPVKKNKVEASDEEVDKVLANLQQQHATYTPIADRPAKDGDMVTIDFVGKLDGKKFQGGTAKGFSLELGKGQLLPDFEKGIVGKSANTEFDIDVMFPEDYQEKKLAGKKAVFSISLKDIKEKQLPKLDDEFAKDLGEFDTLDKVKEKIKTDAIAHKEHHEKDHLKDQIIDALVAQSEMDLPASMVDHYSRELYVRNEFRLRQAGLTHEQLGLTPEKAAQESVESAKKQIKTSYILDAIAEKENISITDEELEVAITNMAAQNRMEPAKYREAVIAQKKLDSLRYQLREDKVLDFLLEKAKTEEA